MGATQNTWTTLMGPCKGHRVQLGWKKWEIRTTHLCFTYFILTYPYVITMTCQPHHVRRRKYLWSFSSTDSPSWSIILILPAGNLRAPYSFCPFFYPNHPWGHCDNRIRYSSNLMRSPYLCPYLSNVQLEILVKRGDWIWNIKRHMENYSNKD